MICFLLGHAPLLLRWWRRPNGSHRYRVVCRRCLNAWNTRTRPKDVPDPLTEDAGMGYTTTTETLESLYLAGLPR